MRNLKWASPAERFGTITSLQPIHLWPVLPFLWGCPQNITTGHYTGGSGSALVSETHVPVSGVFLASILPPPKHWD